MENEIMESEENYFDNKGQLEEHKVDENSIRALYRATGEPR